MRFPSAIAHMRAIGAIRFSLLVFMDFKSGPLRVWLGAGPLVTDGGVRWEGVGDVVGLSGGAQVAGLAAPNLTVTIAATPEMIAAAAGPTDEYKQRRLMAALQFFDDDWQTVDAPEAFFNGVMDQTTFNFDAESATITLNVESPFARRRAARPRFLTDANQRSLYPDDRGLEFVHREADLTVNWPESTT